MLQIHGTAKRTRMASSYANLFIMGKLEQSAIENDPFKPYVWWRFIDHIYMVWTEGEEHLQTFLHHLNSIHPTIKFTHEYSNSSHQSLPFLDLHVYLDNSPVETDLHTKPTDKHQYFLKTVLPSCPHKAHHRFQPRLTVTKLHFACHVNFSQSLLIHLNLAEVRSDMFISHP